jgi:hypothetical protein
VLVTVADAKKPLLVLVIGLPPSLALLFHFSSFKIPTAFSGTFQTHFHPSNNTPSSPLSQTAFKVVVVATSSVVDVR